MPESLAYAVLAARYDGLMRNAINAYCVSEIRKKMIKMMPLSPDLWVLSYIDMLLSALKPLSPSSPDKLNICGKKKETRSFYGAGCHELLLVLPGNVFAFPERKNTGNFY